MNEYLIFKKENDLKLSWVRAVGRYEVEQFALTNGWSLDSIVIDECDFGSVDDENVTKSDIKGIDAFQIYKRGRGQRGKAKKQAAVLVSMRIPADVLKMIDDKAAFNGMDRTAMILSILSKGY
jgi:predicted DNA binding CopG/RHH family protein